RGRQHRPGQRLLLRRHRARAGQRAPRGDRQLLAVGARAGAVVPAQEPPALPVRAHRLAPVPARAYLRGVPSGRLAGAPERPTECLPCRHHDVTRAGATPEGGPMTELRAVDLGRITQMLGTSAKPVSILWQTPGSVAFVARGREHRSEFHVDPSDEVMYMLKGDMELHYLTDTGEERVVLIREGEILHCPAGTPHSPRFAPDAYVLVLERTRRPDEHDRFHWYCRACGARLYEAVR